MGSLTLGVSSSAGKTTCSDEECSSDPWDVMGVKSFTTGSFLRSNTAAGLAGGIGGTLLSGGNLFSGGVSRTAGGGGGGVGGVSVTPFRDCRFSFCQ